MKYSGFSFYAQSGINFLINYPQYNNFYTAKFEFVSEFDSPKFLIETGKIKNKDNKFIYNNNPNNNSFEISGNLSTSEFNLFFENLFIYTETGNFGACSGFNVYWDNIDLENNLNLSIRGDRAYQEYFYKSYDYYENPFYVKISGNENNFGKIIIYNAKIRNTNYADTAFEFSGNTYLELEPGEAKDLVILQKLPYESVIIPFVMETNYGKIYNTFKTIRGTMPPESGDVTIFVGLLTGNELITGDLGNQPYASWAINFEMDYAYGSGFYFQLSGLSGNNNFINNHKDEFSNSWFANYEGQNTGASIAYDFLRSNNISVINSTNSNQNIYNNVNNGYNISTGHYGLGIASSGLAEYHKKYWEITGITLNIYKSGVPTGLSGIIPTGISGLSGAVLPQNIIFGQNASQWKSGIIRNNPSGSVFVSIYEFKNTTGLNELNNIYQKQFDLKNLSGQYLSGAYYTFNIETGKVILNSDKNYLMLFSGKASGYFSGTVTGITGNDLTGSIPIYYSDNIYISKNESYIPQQYTIYTGVYVNNNEINFDNNVNLPIKVDTFEVYDKNQFTGFLPIRQTIHQSYTINIGKQISYNESYGFLGNAMYIISNQTSCYSGYLNTYLDMFKNINVNYTINKKYY
jgi:hypothetical protein